MNGPIWINLPSTDLPRAKKFFTEIGFKIDSAHETPYMVSMSVGQNQVVMNLFDSKMFQGFIGGQTVTDAVKSTEVLFSLGAESPEEVDQLARKVKAAGGTIYAEPGYTDGWMYGFGFIDLDGHRWNGLYMNMAKMPK
ncbi:VOC family protein [Bacteriovorax sp. PP10]|uniref:VOC family protein n=1 Tax=Bacteriovorax antarcticus TaxID=3088717 RepID=A0ABU5VY27_9BACT|nr:VOC family protein [Bacteriovorax sp. PP10]MEA9357263.1 VOC family protein [Bacteriovorax sp. PP10]